MDFDWFLDVVKRAIGTLRSEDVIDSRPGAFAARGVNIVAVNSLVGIEFARVWILGATERAFPPPVRQDPILLDDEREEISQRARAPLAPRSDARQRGGAGVRAGVRGGARAAGRLLRAPRDRREPAAAAVGVLPRARLAARGRARVGRRRRRCWRATDVERIPGDAIGAPIRPGHAQDPDGGQRCGGARPCPSPSATAPICRRASRARSRSRRSSVRSRAFARALAGASAHGSPSATRRGTARSDRTRWTRSRCCCPPTRRCRRPRLRATRPVRSGSCSSGCCGSGRSTEPEQVVRIDALSRGSVIHRIFERFYEEWNGTGPAPLAAEAEQRMRTIAGEECDARARPRRDRLSGDVGGRPGRADRGLRALA